MSTGVPDRMAPYRILVVIQLTAAAFAVLFGALPASSGAVRSIDSLLALILVPFSIVVWFVLPRIPDDIGLDIAIGLDIVLAACSAATIHLVESQFLVGLGLVVFGVLAAYYRPRQRFLLHLALMVLLYGVAVVVNPMLPTYADFVVVAFAICGVSMMVSTMAERLRDQALYDTLTGVLNRRGLDLMAAPLLASARRSSTPITVGLIDLDDFKGFNDSHGHIDGDSLLVDLAAAWKTELRANDVLARFGGDEFALVLPQATEAEALELLERLRSCHSAPWTAGVSRWAPDEDLYVALRRADDSLFELKRHPSA